MGRLIKEALIANEPYGVHYVREHLRGENSCCDITDYAGILENPKPDPDGIGSLILLRELMAGITG